MRLGLVCGQGVRGGRARVGGAAHEADVVARGVVRLLVAEHHAAQLGRELHQPRRQHDAVPVHGELLAHDAAHRTDERRATRHAEGRLDALQAQRLAQVEGLVGTILFLNITNINLKMLKHCPSVWDLKDSKVKRLQDFLVQQKVKVKNLINQ